MSAEPIHVAGTPTGDREQSTAQHADDLNTVCPDPHEPSAGGPGLGGPDAPETDYAN
jgi:hypothetical protein